MLPCARFARKWSEGPLQLFARQAVSGGIVLFLFLPQGVSWGHIYGAAAWLTGIGFTMSLFITGLAFPATDLDQEAKLGILLGSVVSGLGGVVVLTSLKRERAPSNPRPGPSTPEGRLPPALEVRAPLRRRGRRVGEERVIEVLDERDAGRIGELTTKRRGGYPRCAGDE